MKWEKLLNHRKQRYVLLLLFLVMILMGCQKTCSEASSSFLDSIPTFDQQGKEDMKDIYIHIKQQTFQVHLYDNQAVKELINMLPMTVTMKDLNGNEKYIYLNQDFSTQMESIEKIQIGDLMLFGSNCLVLFYDSFPTSYQYTPMGYIEDKENLIKALKENVVEITFEIEKEV